MADGTVWTELAATIAAAHSVVAVGSSTHRDIGGAVVGATEVSAPSGIVEYEPADMTVKVNAGTTSFELQTAIARHGQECPLDPRDSNATIGGIVACGLSGTRRLGVGPLRDHLLEVTFITADGRVVRGGGPTVKNVTGYDVPRLFAGSLGTLGVLVQVILRARPLPPASAWFTTTRDPLEVCAVLHRASTIAWDDTTTSVLLQGHAADIDQQADQAGLVPGAPITLPTGVHRARISIEPARIGALATALRATDTRWLAEVGVGTVHVAADDPAGLAHARDVAHAHDGWLLREAGAPDLEPFGVPFGASSVQRRLRTALDPTGKLSPGRVAETAPAVSSAGVAP